MKGKIYIACKTRKDLLELYAILKSWICLQFRAVWVWRSSYTNWLGTTPYDQWEYCIQFTCGNVVKVLDKRHIEIVYVRLWE